MTKSLLVSLILLSCTLNVLANRVDNLKTDADVIQFINSLHITNEKLRLASPDEIINKHCHIAPRQNIDIWTKADLNNDGKTDLLVIASVDGSQIINLVMMDKGNDEFNVSEINYTIAFQCEFITTIRKGNQQLLLFHQANFSYDIKAPVEDERVDTLVYQFNAFIEQNKHPADYHIKSITLSSSPCFGTCPVRELDISQSGYVKYIGGNYSKKQGTFHSVIDNTRLNDLISLINYLDVKALKDNYAVDWTDFPTCYLTITFDDGTVKKISDYGERGTFGLRRLYDSVWALIPAQKWVK